MVTRRGCIAGLVTATIGLALGTVRAEAQIKQCEEVVAVAQTTWIPASRVEVGPVEGLLNGALYLRFDPQVPVDPARDEANLVISTKEGELLLWVDGKAVEQADGSMQLDLGTLAARGTGLYAAAAIELELGGSCLPEKGGAYKLFGTICMPRIKPRR
jgi:hypothetical protein